MAIIGIAPATTQSIDAGQVLPIQASVINDVLHQGATFSLTGVGTLSAPTLTISSETSVVTANYTAPAAVSAPTAAAVTASAIRTGGQTATVLITVNPAFLLTNAVGSLPAGTVGTAYSTPTITAAGGTGATVYSVSSGTLPGGLALSTTTGVLSGTPTVGGTFSFSIGATDASTVTHTLSASYTVTVAPVITTVTVPNAVQGVAYSQQLAVAGTGTGTTFAITAGSLPAASGLTLSSAGLIAGTPAAGTGGAVYTFSVQATQGGVNSAARTYMIAITAPVTITTASPLPGAGVSAAYSQQLASTGGSNTGYTYSISSGTLPAGITLSSGGLLSGTPAAAGTSTFSITVTDSAGATGSKAFSLTVTATTLMVTTTSLPAGRTNVAYSQQLTYSGGAGGTPTFALASGTLPGGLALGTAGLVSGSPTGAGTFTFSVTVTVGTTTSAAQTLSIAVTNLSITSGTAANGEVGLAFSFTETVSGGSGPYRWVLATGSNALPVGLSLNGSTGAITGTPVTAGSTAVSVMVTDANGFTATRGVTITIAAARTNANNSQLSGQYAFLLNGFDAAGNPVKLAGKFTATARGRLQVESRT